MQCIVLSQFSIIEKFNGEYHDCRDIVIILSLQFSLINFIELKASGCGISLFYLPVSGVEHIFWLTKPHFDFISVVVDV